MIILLAYMIKTWFIRGPGSIYFRGNVFYIFRGGETFISFGVKDKIPWVDFDEKGFEIRKI